MTFLRNLWLDESGGAGAASLILLTTIICLGAIVGLVTLRDQIVQEFGDLAVALESLDQSFTSDNNGSYSDPATDLEDPPDAEPACISVQAPAEPEGG